jgi:NAD(P)-dependent dehydrogenase (short-subunit alcohol dehydrogenase family)
MSGSQLAGKVALITGATSGIGKATARRFAAEGATLLLTGRDRNRARSLLAELEEAGTAAQFVLGDLGQDAAIDELAAVARDRYGRVDALVLNAGVITVAPLTDITTAQYDEMMNVNVRAPWLCVKAMHALLPAGGTITVTASVSSFTIFPGEGAYCMGKAAVIHMVRALAVELRPPHPGQRTMPRHRCSRGHVATTRRIERRPRRRTRPRRRRDAAGPSRHLGGDRHGCTVPGLEAILLHDRLESGARRRPDHPPGMRRRCDWSQGAGTRQTAKPRRRQKQANSHL